MTFFCLLKDKKASPTGTKVGSLTIQYIGVDSNRNEEVNHHLPVVASNWMNLTCFNLNSYLLHGTFGNVAQDY